ncbi:MAG TPA: histidine kinase [Methylovirgula sp.]
MPSLFRFLFIVGAIAGLIYFGMVALVTYVTPQPHEIVETVPLPHPNK